MLKLVPNKLRILTYNEEMEAISSKMQFYPQHEAVAEKLPSLPESLIEHCARLYAGSGIKVPFYYFVSTYLLATGWQNLRGMLITLSE